MIKVAPEERTGGRVFFVAEPKNPRMDDGGGALLRNWRPPKEEAGWLLSIKRSREVLPVGFSKELKGEISFALKLISFHTYLVRISWSPLNRLGGEKVVDWLCSGFCRLFISVVDFSASNSCGNCNLMESILIRWVIEGAPDIIYFSSGSSFNFSDSKEMNRIII